MSGTATDKNREAFFAIVNSEIFLWDTMDVRFKEAGVPITMTRYVPLRFLANRPMRIQELAALCHSGESATSRIVDRMCKDGLIEKQTDKNDGRAVLLHLTDEGQNIKLQAEAVFNAAITDLFGHYSAAELQNLLKLLAPFCNTERT